MLARGEPVEAGIDPAGAAEQGSLLAVDQHPHMLVRRLETQPHAGAPEAAFEIDPRPAEAATAFGLDDDAAADMHGQGGGLWCRRGHAQAKRGNQPERLDPAAHSAARRRSAGMPAQSDARTPPSARRRFEMSLLSAFT